MRTRARRQRRGSALAAATRRASIPRAGPASFAARAPTTTLATRATPPSRCASATVSRRAQRN